MSHNEAFEMELDTTEIENGTELRHRKSVTSIKHDNDDSTQNGAQKVPEKVTSNSLGTLWDTFGNKLTENKKAVKYTVLVLLNIAIFSYFAVATDYWLKDSKEIGVCNYQWCNGYGMLVILMIIVYTGLFYFLILKRYFGKQLYDAILKPIQNGCSKVASVRFIPLIGVAILLAAFAVFVYLDTNESRDRIRSLIGIGTLLFLGFLFSKHPGHIRWRPVVCGVTCQFLLGLCTIRWSVGRDIFKCIGEKVTTFLQYSYAGSSFVFSNFLVYEIGVFAFQVLPVIFFFSFMISVLYYWGAMQWVVLKLGWILQSILGTTVCESVNSSANIFLGMSESPLLIKPYIKDLTRSELHAIMASGFATVSGTVLAAYISFGAEASHLITSSVMAAPAALCYSKLFYPEMEKSKTTTDNIQIEKGTDSSVLDAATNGALAGIQLVLGIIANIIAFVAFISFLNGIVSWLGMLVGAEDLTFEIIFGKIFIPLSWIMGIPWSECEHVGNLIGLKMIINEFTAFERLGVYKKAGLLAPRSAAIATYAICGFANPSSLGIMIGALGAMAPSRKPDITSVAVRAFITGSAVCFLTASFAGLLMTDDSFPMSSSPTENSTMF